MTPSIPAYLAIFEAFMSPIVVAIAVALVWVGAARMGGSTASRYATAGILSLVLLGWWAAARHFGAANVYFAGGRTAPTLFLALVAPLLVAILGVRTAPAVARLLAASPLHWLVAAQVYRVAGIIFLVLLADGHLPWQFALPAGLGDIAMGLFAVVLAVNLASRAPGAGRAVYGWSLFGIADLVVAMTMGATTSPGQIHLFALDNPNLLVSSFPLVMIPTFAVPLALILHGLVLTRLPRLREAREVPAT
ncbi:MAG: hypothetical protein KGL35_20390 [Bradyrhizobium sp.]|nr:hypothetical protein [Bradyrhizobium sp.]